MSLSIGLGFAAVLTVARVHAAHAGAWLRCFYFKADDIVQKHL